MKRGFTLIELLIVLSIFIVMSALLLANYRKFGNSIDATNLAYDIALSVREAQTYGLATQNVAGDFKSGLDNIPHGIHFDLNTPTSYIIFADVNVNSKYDTNEKTKEYTLNNGYKITDICKVTASVETCSPDIVATSIDILFVRPNPDAKSFFYPNGSQTAVDGSPFPDIKVKITSPDGSKKKAVRVLKSGQITVEDTQ